MSVWKIKQSNIWTEKMFRMLSMLSLLEYQNGLFAASNVFSHFLSINHKYEKIFIFNNSLKNPFGVDFGYIHTLIKLF